MNIRTGWRASLVRGGSTLASIVLAALSLIACVPGGHQVTRVPEIRGTLTHDSVPVRNAEVLIVAGSSDAQSCKGERRVAITDESGFFLVPTEVERRYFRSLINPPQQVKRLTSLCFRSAGGLAYFGGQFVTHSDEPASLAITCDDVRPPTKSSILLPQICH